MKRIDLCFYIFFTLVYWSAPLTVQANVISENIQQVEDLFKKDNETLSSNSTIDLANKVIKNRHFYSADTVAKVFILLTNVAINNGEISKAMQFSEDGLAVVGINNVVKIELLLKLASSHYIEGHFHKVNELAQEAVAIAREITSVKHLLIALSYSAMSNALIANNLMAYQELQEIELLLADNEQFNDQIEVIEILALAHLYQQDYTTAKTLYNKAIKLRFESDQTSAIDRSYYYLAMTDFKLNRLDDAYSGFYQAKEASIKYDLPIRIAYANLGLGNVLLSQNHVDDAIIYLQAAEEHLKNKNFSAPYLSTLISLAKAYVETQDKSSLYTVLNRIEKLIQKIDVSYDQLELYALLSGMYVEQGKYQQAHEASEQYIQGYKKYHFQKTSNSQDSTHNVLDVQNRQIALNVAVQSDQRQSYFEKYQQAKNIIYLLLILLGSLLLISLFLYLNQRNQRLNKAYDEVEKPVDYIASPTQTKRMYQFNYKKARKFEYELAVAYLSIDNWSELTFRFNKKIVDEVANIVAILINEHIDEFDHVGLINEGEYLFLSPHQNEEHLGDKLNLLENALNTRYFANLGNFSIKISYAYQSPDVQDIDPYIFLSRLSESTRLSNANFKN